MDLPIVPSFFRKIDIYQRLVNVEQDEAKKNIWESEKTLLVWAASPDHRLVGSYISKKNVIDELKREFDKRVKLGNPGAEKLIDFIISFPKEVMEALAMRGFANEKPRESSSEEYSVKINLDGYTAGKILSETSYLKRTWKYRIWIYFWWFLLSMAFVILTAQAIASAISVVQLF